SSEPQKSHQSRNRQLGPLLALRAACIRATLKYPNHASHDSWWGLLYRVRSSAAPKKASTLIRRCSPQSVTAACSSASSTTTTLGRTSVKQLKSLVAQEPS